MKKTYTKILYALFVALGFTIPSSVTPALDSKMFNRSATYGLLTSGASEQDLKAPEKTRTAIDVNSVIPASKNIKAPRVPVPIKVTERIEKKPLSTKNSSKKITPETENSLEETKAAIPENTNPEQDSIEFQFEDADLENFVTQIEDFFNVTFISADAISPTPEGAKLIKGNKITFKTHAPLSREKAWDLFVTFLYISGFATVPTTNQKFYKIVPIGTAQKSPEPSYIGIDPEKLPDNDQLIRYVYFIQNSSVDVINNVVNLLKSKESIAQPLQESKAILLIDKAYNVKTLMQIVKELDKVTMPQEMTVLKLRRVDAQEVKKLYDELTQSEDKNVARFFTNRKQPTSLYFPENAKIIAEPRTNSLILLGPQDALKKIEDFILKYVDVELDQPYSPIHTYQLKYADVNTVAEIMNKLTSFGKGTKAAESGGVRGSDKYLRPMNFTPEKETNKLIIRGDYEDYLQVKDIIEKLDEPQPQVAIEVLILSVRLQDTKELGAQLRSKDPSASGMHGLLGKNVKFQTSGLWVNGVQKGIQENSSGSGVTRLLADMINLISGGDAAGSTILSLGSDKYGVWGIFKILETVTNTQVISNPFVTTTNKAKATVKVGETRRVNSGIVIAGSNEQASQEDDEANLQLEITPLINSDGKIVLDIDVQINEFGPDASTSISTSDNPINTPTKIIRQVKTNAVVANKEVLALGGLIRTQEANTITKVPILGDIPVLGWFFKNRQKTQQKDNLLILISSQIIRPEVEEETLQVTRRRLAEYDKTVHQMTDLSEHYDPVYQAFFKTKAGDSELVFENYAQEKVGYSYKHVNGRGKKKAGRRKKKKKTAKDITLVQQKNSSIPSAEAAHIVQLANQNNKKLTHDSLLHHMLTDRQGV